MYERFTDRARKVMQLANQEAQRCNATFIGTEHILLGLTKEGMGVGANLLKKHGLDLRRLRVEVERTVKHTSSATTMGRLLQTPQAKRVVEFALDEAHNLQHNYVGTEHLLLGLMREEGEVGARILKSHGLRMEDIRREVTQTLAGPSPHPLVLGAAFRLGRAVNALFRVLRGG
jgi:ATP-dependent Clp protease ATP-binding subunit ClpC